MPRIVLENVPPEVYERLQQRAAENERSVSVEAVELLTQRLPDPPFVTEEIPAPCDLPRGKGVRVPAKDGGMRLPDPPLIRQDLR